MNRNEFESINTESNKFDAYKIIDFGYVKSKTSQLSDVIKKRKQAIIASLTTYESFEVAEDEISRTLDLLDNIDENAEYFKLVIGSITSFLPRNQPLYALTCFVIIPSLMASDVNFRIPHTMKELLPKIFETLNLFSIFNNIYVSDKERLEFLKERSVILINSSTGETKPLTDVVIFTGTSAHADQLRTVFDRRTLFITNGSGHNPIVIGEDANLLSAAHAVLKLSLYNQGQDCAAPNSILVNENSYDRFMDYFYEEFKKIKVGQYNDNSCNLGPISNPKDLKTITSIIVDNIEWIDNRTNGVIRVGSSIVEPTIICKPLSCGGNYIESFAPLIFIQKYKHDSDLATYFENPQYAPNAMYITLYGNSEYVNSIIGKPISGKILHYKDTFLHNTHLHANGVERGVKPYGGYGRGASNLSINGKLLAIPTLPQRDIFEWVAKPLINKLEGNEVIIPISHFTDIEYKNVEKILKIKNIASEKNENFKIDSHTYYDIDSIKSKSSRYIKIEEGFMYHLNGEIYFDYVTTLSLNELRNIREMKLLFESRHLYSAETFTEKLYNIPKEINSSVDENKIRQTKFFKNIYQLLFRREQGPKLAPFLLQVEDGFISNLLDV